MAFICSGEGKDHMTIDRWYSTWLVIYLYLWDRSFFWQYGRPGLWNMTDIGRYTGKMNTELCIFSFSEANLAEHQKRLKNWPKNSDRLVIYDSTLDDRDHAVRYRTVMIEVKRDPTSMWFCASFRPHKEWCLWCGMVQQACDLWEMQKRATAVTETEWKGY